MIITNASATAVRNRHTTLRHASIVSRCCTLAHCVVLSVYLSTNSQLSLETMSARVFAKLAVWWFWTAGIVLWQLHGWYIREARACEQL
jgi:Mg2+/citrate symporter